MGENKKDDKPKENREKKTNEKEDTTLGIVFFSSLILALGSFCLASVFEHRYMFELVAVSMFFGTVAFLTWMIMES